MKRRVRRISAAASAAVAATVVLAVAAGLAATPKGGLYEGKAKGSVSRSDYRTVRIKVSGNAKTLSFRGPHESCNDTFNPASPFFPKIPKVKIGKGGTFKAKRTYKDTSLGVHYLLDWKVEVSGRFTSRTTAKGTAVYEMGHQGRSPVRVACGERHVTWSAKLTK
jgi:hypothetical protein